MHLHSAVDPRVRAAPHAGDSLLGGGLRGGECSELCSELGRRDGCLGRSVPAPQAAPALPALYQNSRRLPPIGASCQSKSEACRPPHHGAS